MKIYLVGGAVRDQLLQLPVKEKDWVVVAETQQSMLAAGFQQVGKDFPVFLHPKTKEEYALARKERKVFQGYHGFEFDTAASVSLEEDLKRRDLTINAIAQNEAGEIIDPYGGKKDIENKILRHVSPAFIEDPVRLLRVARFAARFPDFSIAEETKLLMITMVKSGEVDALVSERVWKECEKAMGEIAPWRFIEVLEACGALAILFPAFYSKKSAVIHVLLKISSITHSAFERIILVLQAIHDKEAVSKLCHQYRVQKDIFEMVMLLWQHEKAYQSAFCFTGKQLLTLFYDLDAFRRPTRFFLWIKLCSLIGVNTEDQGNYWVKQYRLVEKVSLPETVLATMRGREIGEYIEAKRLEILSEGDNKEVVTD